MFIIHPQDGLLSVEYGYMPIILLDGGQIDFLTEVYDLEIELTLR